MFVGNGIRKLIERAVPDNTDIADTDKVFNEFKRLYQIHCNDKTGPYPGIIELLRELKNITLKWELLLIKLNQQRTNSTKSTLKV